MYIFIKPMNTCICGSEQFVDVTTTIRSFDMKVVSKTIITKCCRCRRTVDSDNKYIHLNK